MDSSHGSTATPQAPTRLITQLQQTIDDTIRPLLAGSTSVALLGFPGYANVGDSAIWLGTIAYLRALGIAPRYVCDAATYWRDRLAQRLGTGTILLQGGGSLGDLWEAHQHFREMIIDAFPDNPIIQLPQSIHFRERPNLVRAGAVFDRHRNLTVLVRDQHSLSIARNEFGARSMLCPDMAFCLGPLSRPAPPSKPVVWLARTDQESAQATANSADTTRVDWLVEHIPALLLTRRVARTALLQARGMRWLGIPLSWTYNWQAHQRLRRGCRIVAAGRVVITDRLHGHILCLLLGVPHVLRGDRHGKVRSFYDTWTGDSVLTRWCDSDREALRLAGELVGGTGST